MKVSQGKRILLVDDEPAVRGSTRMLLELDGHQVTEVEDAFQALKVFQPGAVDLVLTDFRMPGLNGGELTARIKQLAPQQAVIILTAWPEEVPRQTPADAILAKPYTLACLRQAVATAC